jgi:type IV pilus assembly protein PilC
MATTYAYTARDRVGKVITGTLEGDNETAVAESLRRQGYIISNLQAQRQAGGFNFSLGGGKKVKSGELVVFSRQFATMINAGLPLARCLGILGEQTENPGLASTVQEVLRDVEGGLALSAALDKHPKVFNTLYVSMVKAGETGGILDDVLLNIAENLEKSEELKKRIKSAMAYPVLMFIMSIVLVLVMVTFIVPIFADMFKTLGGQLPIPTQMLVWLSAFVRATWMIAVPGTIAVYIGIRRAIKVPSVHYKWDSFKIRAPVFGKLIKQQALSRFARTLGVLSSAGVPILESLEVVEKTVNNMEISAEVGKVRIAVKEGETIAKPLSGSKIFPPMVVQMISVGEESGAMDTMLLKIADFYDKEVATAVEALTSLIEPLMIIFVGGLIGGILISLYLPMFQMASLIE